MASIFEQRAKQVQGSGSVFEKRAKLASAISGALADQAAGTPAPQGPTADFAVPDSMTPPEQRAMPSIRKALAAIDPQKPEPQGTLRGDLYHAIGRGGIRAMAAAPGALASLMEAGEKAPGGWGDWGIPGTSGERAKTIMSLRAKARDIYKLSDAESLRAKRGGATGMLVNLVGETIPQFGVSAVAALLGGPAGVVAVSAAMGGEEVYQNLIDLGVDPDKANAARWVTGPIIGLVEKLQIDGVLRIGNKAAVKRLVQAARERAFKKMAAAGVDITFDHAMKAAGEGLQEVLQEGIGIGAEVALARDFDPKADLIRLGSAFIGGAIVSEGLGAGMSMARGGSSVLSEVQNQDDVATMDETISRRGELEPPSVDEPVQPATPEMGSYTPTVQTRSGGIPVDEGPAAPGAAPEAPGPEIVAPAAAEEPLVQPEPANEAAQEDPAGRPYMSPRNADMETRAGWMGNPPVPEQIPAGTLAQRRQAAIDGGYDKRAGRIAKDILENPRPAKAEETHGLDIRAEQVESEHAALAEQLDAMQDGSPEQADALELMGKLEEEHAVIAKVLRWAGTEWSAAGFARQHRLGDNSNTPNVLGRAAKAAGKAITPKAKASLTEGARKVRKKRKQAGRSLTRDTDNAAKRAVKRASKLGRYAKMTTEELDAELADLLSRERTPLIIHDIVLNIAARTPDADLETVTHAALQHLPGLERSDITEAIVQTSQRKAQNSDAMTEYLRALRRKYRKVKQLRTDIADVLYWMEQGRMPDGVEPTVGLTDNVIQKLEAVLDQLKKLQQNSEPAEQQRLERRIAFLKGRLAAKDFDTKKAVNNYKPSRRTLQLQYEAAQLDAAVAREIYKQKEIPWWKTVWGESLRTVMALKSSFDLSALGNQGGWVLLSHPVRALKTMPRVLRAAASDKTAYEINEGIKGRPNAPYYFRDGLELTETADAGNFTEREEMFRSEWVTRIPVIGRGVAASNRAFATTLNLLRADSYDSMASAFADEGGPTEVEGRAIAEFVNMATGRGNVRGAGAKRIMHSMNGIFWAPRRALSRFQMLATLGGQLELGSARQEGQWKRSPIHLRGSRRVRRMFAKELARYLAGLATVYFLGELAGGEVTFDTRSSDCGKIRFGNTRLDPLSGMSQTLTFVGRNITHERKDQAGNITPLSGYDMERTWARFLKNKVSPGFTVAWAGFTGDTPFDGPTTPWWLMKEAVTPISVDDIYEVMQDQGVPRGTILSMLGVLGIGVQVYGESTSSASVPRRGAL